MKKTFKQMTAWLLVVAMLASFLPIMPIAAEEETGQLVNRDAFGIAIKGELTAEELEYWRAKNPYGTEEWFPLFTVNELFYVEGHDDGRYWRARDYDGEKMTTVRGSGTLIGSKNEGNGSGFNMMDTSPIDLYGTGSKEYVATVAYWHGGDKLELFVTDKNGDRVTNTYNLAEGDQINNLDDVPAYATTGFVSVAAGDFDGDGKETIIAYIPRMEGAAPAIAEYKVENGNISWVRDVLNTNVFDILGNHNLQDSRSKAERVLRNTPVVQILAEDVDNDNIDEVIITAGMNDTYDPIGKGVDGNGMVGSQLFIYDFMPEYPEGDTTVAKFTQTFKTALHESGSGQRADASGRLRFASSSVGNVTATSGGADYPEIISAGWVDSDGGNGIGLDGKKINFNQVTCTKVTVVGGTPVGNYSHSSLGSVETKEFVYGGFYDDSVEALVPVQVFSAWGASHADAIFAGGVVYKVENGQIKELYHRGYFGDDDDGIDDSIITNGLIIDVTAGNFTNDPDGREQLVFATMQKRASLNQYFSCMYTYTCDEGSYSDPGSGWNSYDDGWLTYKEGDAFITLCAPDLDPSDSTVVKIKSVTRTYTEPEVLAILEATPYFAEIPDSLNNSETVYGKSDTTGTGTGSSNTLQTNVVAGFEWSMDDVFAGFACGAGFEATIENNFTWATSEEQYETFEVSYSNDSGENAVIVYRRPVIAYEYEVRGSDKNLVLAKEGELSTSMITVEEYNEAAEQYGLDKIPEGLLAEPGDPFSYRSSKVGLDNVATKDNNTTQYNGTGTVTQSFTNGTSTSSEYTYELNTSFTAYGLVFGAKVGGGAGYAHTTSETTVNTSEISKTGTVSGVQVDGYDFQWQFAHWNTTINGTVIPVLGYIVKDVLAPPSPPEDLGVDDITTTSATITWNHGSRPAEEYRIYQYFAANDKYIQIASVDGTETSCEIGNLLPDNTYTVVIRAYSAPTGSVGIGGESVNSEPLAFSTAPEGAAPIVIDGAYDVFAKVGANATFKADVTLPGDKYTTVDYQWQVRESGSAWVDINKADGASLTLEGVTQGMDGNLYRCEISALYSGSLITYYSDTGKLHVGKASADATLEVSGYTGGNGTAIAPYLGKSDYLVQSGTSSTEVITSENVTIANGDVELIVYGTAVTTDGATTIGAPYYGYDSENGEYYALTESDGEFTVIDKIVETIEKSHTGIDGAAVTAPTGFDSAIQVSKTEAGDTYYLFAAVEGTAKTPIEGIEDDPETEEDETVETVDTRLESVIGITYYWGLDGVVYEYGEDGALGNKVDISIADLYNVYAKTETAVVLGRGETYTVLEEGEDGEENEYIDMGELWYYTIDITAGTEGAADTYTVTPFIETESVKYTVGDDNVDFSTDALTTVTKEIINTVSVPVYSQADGTTLSLSTTVTENDGKAISGAIVTFRIVNTVTGAVEEIKVSTDTSGKANATWRAPTVALYSIEASVSPSANYLGATSAAKFYDALGTATADNTTEYRLLLTSNGETLTGSMPFGGTFGYKIQSRDVGESVWADYISHIGESFTYTITAPGKAETEVDGAEDYTPASAGVHTVKVYKGDTIDANALVAAASLNVTRLAVTITPTWTVTPSSADEVTLVSSYGAHTNEYLKSIFDINCTYFINHSASGIFNVTLGYKNNSTATDFKNNHQVSLGTDSFTIKPSSATVYFTSGENGTLVGRSGDNLFLMASGSSQTSGTKLTFNAEPVSGYAVDKWIVNGTEYKATDVNLPDWFTVSGNALIINSFDASAAGGQTKDGAIHVEVTFASAANLVTYSVSGNEGGTISAVVDDGNNTALISGTSVAKGADVIITATPDSGYVIDRWVVNNENYTWESGDVYAGKVLTLSDIEENYTVVVYFTESTSTYSVNTSVYSESGAPAAELATISAVNAENGEAITALSGIAKNTSITFTANLNETNNTVKEWQISTNGTTFTTVKGSGGQISFTLYNLSGNMYVRAIVTNAQSYTLNYAVFLGGEPVTDESIAKLTAVGNGAALASGGSYGAYIPVEFALVLNPDYYVVEWSDIVTPDESGKNASLASLNASLEIDVVIAEKPVVTVLETANGTVTALGTNADATDTNVNIAEADAEHVDLNSSVKVTATPDADYYVESITVGAKTLYNTGTDAGVLYGARTVTLDKVSANANVTVTFALKPEVKVIDTANGAATVTVQKNGTDATVTDGESEYADKRSDITIVATPDVNYYVSAVKVAGVTIYTDNETDYNGKEMMFDVENIVSDTQIEVIYAEKPVVTFVGDSNITVTAAQGENDLASGAHVEKYSGDITFTATPAVGYETDKWTLGGTEVAPENENATENDVTVYTVEGLITADVTIVVTAKAIPQYTITLTAEKIDEDGAHGEISASVTRKALDGYAGDLASGDKFYRDSDITIIATPDEGYRIKTYTWNIGGTEGQGIAVPTELLKNVQGDVTITARFVKIGSGITFDPTDAESTGGYISAATAANMDVLANANGLTLEAGVQLTLTATVKTGYEVAGWYTDGRLVEGTEGMTAYTYTSNGEDETAITVQFRQVLYTVKTEIDHGTIEVTNLTEGQARGGETLTFTAIPDIGYAVSDWMVGGESQNVGGNSFSWTVVNGAALDKAVDTFTVKAVLVRDSYTVTYTDTTGGTLASETASGSYVADGADVTIVATPDTGYTFKSWTVNGKKHAETTETLTLTVTADTTVEATFEAITYTVSFETVGEAGTIKATVGGKTVKNGDKVGYNSEIVFTVTPKGTGMVDKWTIDGVTPEGYAMTDAADAQLTYTTVLETDITVSVEIIACPTYTVTVTAGENGSVSEESIEVSRNGSVTVVATPDDYYQFENWTVDGVLDDVTGTTLTLENIKKDIAVSAAFKEAIRYDITFEVVCETGNNSTASVTAGGTAIYPTATEPVRVVGNSEIVFTAAPAMNGENNADMVASWVVNGETVDNISNVLTIAKITEKTDVVLTFTEYVGYAIPTDGTGYTITDVVRTPDDTTPAGEIRNGGDLTFKVTPTDAHYLTTLTVNGVNCLTETESGNVTVVDNGDGSYTVTVTDVDALTFAAESMMFQIVTGELTEVPTALAEKYDSLTKLESALRTAVTKVNNSYKNMAFFDIVLQYTTDGGATWQEATAEHFPAGGVKVTIPYADIADNLDNTYTYTVVHMFTNAMDGHAVGDTETITPTKTEMGIEFTVKSFSPFTVGYYKATSTPSSGGGSGLGGGLGSGSKESDTYTVKASATVGGKISPEGDTKVEKGESITFTVTASKGYVLKEILVDGVSVGAHSVYTIENVVRAYRVEAVFEETQVCTEATCPMSAYNDLLYTAWYHDGVHYCIENKLMTGISAKTFAPDMTTSRAMIVTLLWRMEGSPVVNYAMSFKDVAADAWYTEAVRWAASERIVEGYSAISFGPDDVITREQLATIFYRYEQYKGGGFTEAWTISMDYVDIADVSEWAYEAMCWMNMNGIVNGKPGNVLDPKGSATRAEAATMLYRYCEAK